jgi:hypothetical protein
MPEYIIKNETISKYFRIDGDDHQAAIVSMSEATSFGSKASAIQALREAAATRVAQGKHKPGAPVPKWATAALGAQPGELADCFTLMARPTLSDLVGVFDVFFVRSSSGWLCRPHMSCHDGRLCWDDSFAFAVQFPDEAAAKLALAGCRSYGASVVKASCVFTGVAAEAGAGHDGVRDAIASACEARDITGAIEASARERIDAMQSAPKRTSARL